MYEVLVSLYLSVCKTKRSLYRSLAEFGILISTLMFPAHILYFLVMVQMGTDSNDFLQINTVDFDFEGVLAFCEVYLGSYFKRTSVGNVCYMYDVVSFGIILFISFLGSGLFA